MGVVSRSRFAHARMGKIGGCGLSGRISEVDYVFIGFGESGARPVSVVRSREVPLPRSEVANVLLL